MVPPRNQNNVMYGMSNSTHLRIDSLNIITELGLFTLKVHSYIVSILSVHINCVCGLNVTWFFDSHLTTNLTIVAYSKVHKSKDALSMM